VGAATTALALLVLLLLRASGVPDAEVPGTPDDHLSGADNPSRRVARMRHPVAAARRLAFEVGARLRSLRRAARALYRHGWLPSEAWLARCVDTLLPGHHDAAFVTLAHLIAGTDHTLHRDGAALLGTAVASLAKRRRSLPWMS